MSRFEVLTEELIDQIEELGPDEQSAWLFLSEHETYSGRWKVEGVTPSFFFDFEDIIGAYRTVSPATLGKFLDRAEELEYRILFADDPADILKAWEDLDAVPPFSINSDLEGTTNGMLPFQIQGYNYLKNENLKAGFALWSTGTGKTVFEISMIKHHMEVNDEADLCVIVVKSNNKIDTQKKILALGDIESVIIDGTPSVREDIYIDIFNRLEAGEKVVAITNYEKFRDDEDFMAGILAERRVLMLWDEMPTKLRNRSIKLYKSVINCLYGKSINWNKKNPSWLRQYMLTATPVENSPVDVFNCIRLLDPEIFPKVKEWEKKFVATRNYFTKDPETFHNLEQMGLEIEFMTHQVDKEDPDIAKMFPEAIKDIKYIDWDTKFRKVYDKLQSIAAKLKEEEEEEEISILALISVLQMLCDAPEMVSLSASNRAEFEKYLAELGEDEYESYGKAVGSQAATLLLDAVPEGLTNEGHPKIEKLKELLTEVHPDEKFIVFSTFSHYIFPSLEKLFDEWGVSYVTYTGSDKQKQENKDRFRNDPDVRVFLSSDAGSDSIDLPEASVVVHYNSPWKWSTEIQRENRANRVNSLHKMVYYYVLVMENSVEDRKRELISNKHGYHKSIFKGGIAEEAISSRMTKGDLLYILTGQDPEAG